ncbi:MAG: methyltransferase domain-containing protein [Alphaproteobacteria bacterium]
MNAHGDTIQPHHEAAATMWGLVGVDYDDVSFAIADALGHAAQRLNAKPGEKVLDVATGTGWSARNVARYGAAVTGVDISTELLGAAKTLSSHVAPPIAFRRGDAEALPFEDASFDRVISTFGVMFAADQTCAAAELARVCKPGGRLVLAAWVPGGAVAEFFGVIGRFSDAPPPAASPMNWGEPDAARALLGDGFELTFETGVNHAYYDGVDDIWDWYQRGFGPVRAVTAALDEPDRAAFKAAVDDYHRHYACAAGLHIKRDYLIAIGRRRGG